MEHDVQYAPYASIDVELWDPYRFRRNRSVKLHKKDRPPLELAFFLIGMARMRVYIIDLRKVRQTFQTNHYVTLIVKIFYWLGAQDMT